MNGLISETENLALYQSLFAALLSGDIDASRNRHDLGSHQALQSAGARENITQIMWPSDFVSELEESPMHLRAQALARELFEDDTVSFDFDFAISKAEHSNTAVPWHQDESYWPVMPDKRAVSCWMALDPSTRDNGAMWYEPATELLPHRPAAEGSHVLMCDWGEARGGTCVELSPGDCVFHAGRTLHYSRGNTTNTKRRAFVSNYRPREMVAFERSLGFDHGKSGVAEVLGSSEAHAKKPDGRTDDSAS